MAERIGIHGVSDEILDLLPSLAAHPDLEVVRIYTGRLRAVLARLPELDTEMSRLLVARLSERSDAVSGDRSLTAIIEATRGLPTEVHARGARGKGPRVLSTREARELWGAPPDTRPQPAPPLPPPRALSAPIHALVDTLSGLLSAFETAGGGTAGFARLLQLSVQALGAEGGSLMLLDDAGSALRVRAALGLDATRWPEMRLPLGAGIAGRIAVEQAPVEIRGPSDPQLFPDARPRSDRQAALCIPLRQGERVLGILNLHHTSRSDAFAPGTLAVAQQVGELLAEVIERTLAAERMREDAQRFEVLRALQAIFESGEGLHAQLTAVCGLAAARAGGGIAELYRADEAGRSLRLAASSLPAGVPAAADLRVPVGEGIEGEVARTRNELRLRGDEGGWLWSLPLLAGDDLAGVLSLKAGSSQHWDNAREAGLRELAARLAAALLRTDSERARAQRENDFEQLADASLRMLSSRDLGEVLRLGTSEATRTLGADHAVVRLLDPRTGQLAVRSYSGSAEGPLQEALFRLDRKLAGDLLDDNASRRIESIAADSELSAHGESACSAIATPLREGKRVLGTLAVYDKLDLENLEPIAFEARDLQRLERFAQHLEHALRNAHLRARTGGQELLDEETELPQQAFLERRVREEVGRGRSARAGFTLVSVRIENLEILASGGPTRAMRCLQQVADSLRSRIRDFDIVARCATAEFGLLLPEPGSVPEERVLDLARAVSEDVAKPVHDAALRPQLAFGHASFPAEGDDWVQLISRAREARIRNI